MSDPPQLTTPDYEEREHHLGRYVLSCARCRTIDRHRRVGTRAELTNVSDGLGEEGTWNPPANEPAPPEQWLQRQATEQAARESRELRRRLMTAFGSPKLLTTRQRFGLVLCHT